MIMVVALVLATFGYVLGFFTGYIHGKADAERND